MQLIKYPRTHHIEGSRFQPGDEDLECIPFEAIKGRNVVIEEKMDGSNSALSFDADGNLLLQSRGHFLTGGEGERHFDLFKQWATTHARELYDVLGHRYICFGEWVYAKHTILYDKLPHYWLEFDILDRETNMFLSTSRRLEILKDLPVVSVRVLHSGVLNSRKELEKLMGRSHFVSEQRIEYLRLCCEQRKLNFERALKETDSSLDMEGLYIKVEEDGVVSARYKFIRTSFLQAVKDSAGHWADRKIIPNKLQDGSDIFLPAGAPDV